MELLDKLDLENLLSLCPCSELTKLLEEYSELITEISPLWVEEHFDQD